MHTRRRLPDIVQKTMANPERQTEKEQNRRLLNRERAQGKTILAARPFCLQLEPTNRCNLKCSICGRSHWQADDHPPGEMSRDILARIEPWFETAEEVVLGGYGEPLLAEIVWSILAAAAGRECRSRLITNGTRLSEDICSRLMDRGLSELVVSIDAPTELGFHRIRACSLQNLLQRLNTLKKIRQERGSEYPHLVINTVINRNNWRELPAMVALAANLGATRMHVMYQKIYSHTQQQDSVLLSPRRLRRIFRHARKEADRYKLELHLPPPPGAVRDCMQPFEMLFIRHNGTVMGCCSAVFSENHYAFRLGNIQQSDPEELWNHPAMQHYREAFYRQENFPERCRFCAFRITTPESYFRPLDEA